MGSLKKNMGWYEHNLRKCNLQILFISKKIFIFFFHFRNYCNIIILVVAGPVQLNSLWPELFSATCNLWTFGTVSYKFRFFYLFFIFFIVSRNVKLSACTHHECLILLSWPNNLLHQLLFVTSAWSNSMFGLPKCLTVCDDWMFWFGKMLEVLSKSITKTYKLTW